MRQRGSRARRQASPGVPGQGPLRSGLERCQSELLETGDLRLREGLEGEVCECGSPPKSEGIPKRQRSAFRLTARELPPAALQQPSKRACIEPFRRNAQHVARGLREQELFAGSVGKESLQPREIDVQDRVDRLWCSISPEPLDESLARDRLIRMDDEEAEERALFRTPSGSPCWPRMTSRPEDAKVEIQLPVRASWYGARSANRSVPVRLLDVFVSFSRCFPGLDRRCVRILRSLDPLGGPILVSLVLALALVPSATAYEVPSKLNEIAHVYSLGVGEVCCPSRGRGSGLGVVVWLGVHQRSRRLHGARPSRM